MENQLVSHGGSLLAGADRWGRDALVACFGDEGVAAPDNRLHAGSCNHMSLSQKREERVDVVINFLTAVVRGGRKAESTT